jgi:DNA-binding NarL/FixJ family response regulator
MTMQLALTAAEQNQFASTARVLLSPLDEPVGPWRQNVLGHLSQLLQSPMGGFVLPTAEPPPYSLHNLPDAFAHDYFAMFRRPEPSFRVVQREDMRIWSTRTLVANAGLSVEEGWFATSEYRDFYSRYDIREGMGFVVPAAEPPLPVLGDGAADDSEAAPMPTMGAVLTCFSDVFGTDAFGDRGLAILRMLLPALEAGVAGRVRLGWLRRTLHDAFDAVQDGLELRNAAGRLLHANAALTRIVQDDPQRERIADAMEHVCNALRGTLRSSPDGDAIAALNAVTSDVRTDRARYRVRGQFVSGSTFGAGTTIIISIARLTPTPPSREALQERWGLTRQEARVALLLAQGCSNARIAAELQLGRTTTRHYTEAVFLKLSVHSRAEAARRILVD